MKRLFAVLFAMLLAATMLTPVLSVSAGSIPDILADNGLPVVNIPIDESDEGCGTIEELNANLDDILADCEKKAQVSLDGAVDFKLRNKIKNGKLTIGRNGAKAMVSVPNDGKLSGLHATFTKQGNSLLITDNGSTNGTKVNGNKIAPNVPTPLQQNDTVTMGSTTYTITWR